MSRAKAHGVTCLALTDHDTLDGIDEATEAAKEQGITLIPGIEFSTQWKSYGIHIVGLNLDRTSEKLKSAVGAQSERRHVRTQMIAEKLEKVGVKNALQGALDHADGQSIGRPHFAKYLVAQGIVKDINQAFKQYLGAGKPGDVKQLWPQIGDAIEWITNGGGVPVLAHPDKYKMTRTKLLRLVDEFKEAGGRGIEVISGAQSKDVTDKLQTIALEKELLASRGSDFHQPDQQWQELGCGASLHESLTPVWEAWEH